LENAEFEAEAKSIVQTAHENDLILRALGATAFRIHCPNYLKLHDAMNRKLSDLDFAAYSKGKNKAKDVMAKKGYLMDRNAEMVLSISGRFIATNPVSKLHADVFFDELSFCHKISLKGRLEKDFPTIPLAELLLEKMQIVKLNEKDIKDSILLLREHGVGPADDETINHEHIADIMSKDWGFYYTFTTNMKKLKDSLNKFDVLGQEDRDDVALKIDKILELVEAKPKSLSWKIRARSGTKMKWYNDVEEIYTVEKVG
jgi:hypothetical protein